MFNHLFAKPSKHKRQIVRFHLKIIMFPLKFNSTRNVYYSGWNNNFTSFYLHLPCNEGCFATLNKNSFWKWCLDPSFRKLDNRRNAVYEKVYYIAWCRVTDTRGWWSVQNEKWVTLRMKAHWNIELAFYTNVKKKKNPLGMMHWVCSSI